MRRQLAGIAALTLLAIAGTCRSLVGAEVTVSTPEPSPTPLPTLTPTPPPTPLDFEILLWPQDDSPMVLVPTGDFLLGLDDPPGPEESSIESPAHTVYLEAFWIDRYEVTNERFSRFIAAGGYQTRQFWTNAGWQWVLTQQVSAPLYWNRPDFGLPQHPVVAVTWYEAYAYCLWSGKRLPTEAEWEKAARGPDARRYPWGDDWDCRRGNFDDETLTSPAVNECAGGDGHNLTAPVGSYEAGQSVYHAHDMAGNVWEWTLSQLMPYPYQPNDGRNLPEGQGARVTRGASWLTFTGALEADADNHARVTFRSELPPDTQSERVGFRCVVQAE